jgi:hypothetical protein
MNRAAAIGSAPPLSRAFPDTYEPILELLRQTVSPKIAGYSIRKIKTAVRVETQPLGITPKSDEPFKVFSGSSDKGGHAASLPPQDNTGPTNVYRISLRTGTGPPDPAELILKHVSALRSRSDDASSPDREVRFYTDLLPRTGILLPVVYYAGLDWLARDRLILLEDLKDRYRFPPSTYLWRPAEIERFLKAYAHLHVSGGDLLPPEDQRGWMFTYYRPRWSVEEVLRKVNDLHAWGIWPTLPSAEKLIERTLASLKELPGPSPTLLHHDVYPPNVGLPVNPDGHAVIIDWEMGGWGPAEIDLAYLLTQPFGASARIGRQQALDSYWSHRRALEGRLPPAAERRCRQWLAEALFCLAEIGVAHRVARQPFPRGSAPDRYWQAMYGVVFKRLIELGSVL